MLYMSVMAKMISKFHETNKDLNMYDDEDERLIAEFLITCQDQNKKLSNQKLMNMTKMRVSLLYSNKIRKGS